MRFIKLTFECFGILVTHNHENITKELEQILFKESFVVIALFLKNSCKITKKRKSCFSYQMNFWILWHISQTYPWKYCRRMGTDFVLKNMCRNCTFSTSIHVKLHKKLSHALFIKLNVLAHQLNIIMIHDNITEEWEQILFKKTCVVILLFPQEFR